MGVSISSCACARLCFVAGKCAMLILMFAEEPVLPAIRLPAAVQRADPAGVDCLPAFSCEVTNAPPSAVAPFAGLETPLGKAKAETQNVDP